MLRQQSNKKFSFSCITQIILIIIIIITKWECASAANILTMIPLPAKSHWIIFDKLSKALAERGHHVDVVSHFPPKETVKGYNHIDISGSSPLLTNNLTFNYMASGSFADLLHNIFIPFGVDVCRNTFKSNKIQELLKNPPRKYDIVITEMFSTDCMLGWAWKFDAISISVTSSDLLPWGSDRFGLPDNPAYIHHYFSNYEKEITLYGRIMNTWALWKSKLLYKIWSDIPSNRITKDFFGENMPDLEALARNISLLLINRHFSISGVRPTLPNIIDVGGLHLDKPKPLDKNFSTILNLTNTDQKGIILFTMGSLLLTETFPVNILQNIFDTFAELPYRVLWRGDESKMLKTNLRIPSNIHFISWLPQFDILCDPRMKLFITHGGLMGGQEAVYCGIPVLGMPLFADQFINLQRAEALGYARVLNIHTLTKDEFSNALRSMLLDSKYSENVQLISRMFNDRPITPTESAIYWVEYILKYKTVPQFYNVVKDLQWYQLYFLDIVAIFFILVTVFNYLTNYSLRYLVKFKQDKVKSN